MSLLMKHVQSFDILIPLQWQMPNVPLLLGPSTAEKLQANYKSWSDLSVLLCWQQIWAVFDQSSWRGSEGNADLNSCIICWVDLLCG